MDKEGVAHELCAGTRTSAPKGGCWPGWTFSAAGSREKMLLEAPAPLDCSKDYPYGKGPPYLELIMITSKLTSKAQTTIPQPVRAALRLKEGDELLYQLENGRVILTKARQQESKDDPFVTFTEWDSEADRKAYANL